MIEAYAVGVQAKLEDGVTPSLLKIVEGLDRANAAMREFAANARALSRLSISVGKSLDAAARGALALGDAAGGLTRASYVLDTMAASSAAVARNLAAAKAESVGMGSAAAGGRGRSGGSVPPAAPPVAPVVPAGGGGSSSSGQFAKNAAAGVGITAAYGLYENARLQDLNMRSAATAQVPFPEWAKSADELREQEFEYARKFAFATHGRIAPFGEAMLESSRLLRTLKPEDQRILTDAAMPYAAVEAKLKGIELPEALGAFIGLAHQAGAYKPKEAEPLFEGMMQASLTTHSSLDQIARAASYALPALHAAGANSGDVMMMLATMMQAGILNTKSGTWLNAMALNALPNTLGSGLFKNKAQNEALHKLGLYSGNQSNFYKNGQFDLMKEVAILAAAREHMNAETFNVLTRQGFGIQGQRAVALFSEPQVVENLHALQALTQNAQPPASVAQMVNTFSTVAKADQTIANANMTLMNATDTFAGPADSLLSKMSRFFGWTADFTKQHPVAGGAMDVGLAVGAVGALGAAWKGGAVAAETLGKKVIPFLAKHLWSIISRALGAITGQALIVALELGSAVSAVGAATIALGIAIAAAVGYGIGKVMTWAIDAAAHKLGAKDFDLANYLGGKAFDLMHGHQSSMPQQAPQVRVQIDGEDVRHHIMNNTHPVPARGQQGLNPQHSPFSPGLATPQGSW